MESLQDQASPIATADFEENTPSAKKGKSRDMNLREQTLFHMGVYDIEAMDALRKKMHELYVTSFDSPQALELCLEVAEQMFLPYRFLTNKSQVDKFDQRVEQYREQLMSAVIPGMKMKRADYSKIRMEMLAIMTELYRMKHNAGLRIPSERVKTADDKIDEVTIRK